MSWNRLPAELRLKVWKHLLEPKPLSRPRTKYDPPPKYIHTGYATVAWEWEVYFGQRNFSSLLLTQSDIPYFNRILNRKRRLSLRRLWLHVELPSYTCESCNVEETPDEANTNSKIYTSALWGMFTALKGWEHDKQSGRQLKLAMVLSVSSPSDTEHHFRHVPARHIRPSKHRTMKGVSDIKKINNKAHGWYGGVQVVPSQGARLRHVGKPLVFDLAHVGALRPPISLPRLSFVHSLWTPRQFHRAIPKLDHILHSLPMLTAINYESWCHVQPSDEWARTTDLRQIVANLPHNLEKLSMSEDYTEALNSGVHRTYDAVATASLRRASLNLVELDASGLADAHWFFWPFSEGYRAETPELIKPAPVWERLEALTLSSEWLTWNEDNPGRLHGLTCQQAVDELLERAASAALLMPKLRVMQLWNGRLDEACIFRYTASEACRTRDPYPCKIDGPLIERIGTKSPTPRAWTYKTRTLWQQVADKYGHGRLHLNGINMPAERFRSYGSVLKYLDLPNKDMRDNQSLMQQLWEADNLKFAQEPPAQS